MLKKVLMISAVMILSTILFTGCSDTDEFGGDPLHDKVAITNLVTKMKEKAGTPLMIFQNIYIKKERFNFSRQDQNKLENIDSYVWSKDSGWEGPQPLVLTGDGKIADNVFNVDDVNWEAIPDFVAETEKRAKEAGMDNGKVEHISVYLDVEKNQLSLSTTIKSDKKEAYCYGDAKTGKIKEFSKK